MIRAIIFDFFGVLALQGASSFRKKFYANDQAKLDNHKKLQGEHHTGRISYDDFIDELAKLGGTDRETVLNYTERYEPNIELLDFISQNLKKNYKLGIISNAGTDVAKPVLGDKYGQLFDDIILSYKVGMIKPEPEIYKMSANNLGVDKGDCVFIDDILTYCQGAEQVGMNTIWYLDFEKFKQEIEKLLAAASNN